MKKLLDGIRDFHEHVRPGYREKFAHLALEQSPDCLFIACSDSRVVPNLFASTDPGDLFVLRNVGNVVPPVRGAEAGGGSAGAAIEFATLELGVRDVVVCGHSSCGAMRRLAGPASHPDTPHIDRWLRHAAPSLERLKAEERLSPMLAPVDRLSQAHVLQQLDHLMTYPQVSERVADGRLRLHGWWFDLQHATVLGFDTTGRRFIPLVELHPA